MSRIHKKLIIAIILAVLVTPIGLLLPEVFKAGDAWGEWSVETIKEKIGFVPSGMEKDAKIWKAPLPDYNIGNEKTSLMSKSGSYILSGFVGVSLISLLSFALFKLMKKE